MRKLATASFSYAAAIFISHYLLPLDWLLIFSATAAALSLFGLFFRGYIRRRIIIVLVSLAVGFAWSRAYTTLFVAPTGSLHGQTAYVTATATSYPSATARGYRVDASIHSDEGHHIGARLYYYTEAIVEPGDIIEVKAAFFRTDGMDDSERVNSLVSRGTFIAGYVSGSVNVAGATGGVRFFPLKLANSMADMIERLFQSDVSPFLKALLAGNRDELNHDAALTTALSASGLSHIVAVSGLHVTFLMGFLAMVVRNKRLFAFFGIPFLLLFMSMTGFTPSVTRAGIMQAFLICAPLFKRESDSLTSLSAALLMLLLLNPYAAASVGLQLSFTATLGIIMFSGRINSAITDDLHESKRCRNKAIKAAVSFVLASLSTTFGALVFTIPLSAIHFGVVSLVSPVTNLLTLWAVSFAFPLGIAACVFGFVFFPLGSIVAFPVGYAARYTIFIARALAAVPYSAIYSSNTHIMFWLAYVYTLFITMPLLRARVRQYVLPCCAAVLTLCAILVISPLLPDAADSAVTVLDVGQGLSVVIASDENTALVDCGSSSFENAGFTAHEFLSNSGRNTIDLLILTHFHSDHANGVEYLLSRMNITALAIPDPERSFLADEIIALARRRGTDIIYVTETLRVSLGKTELVLYPPVGGGNENERGLSVLCLGDVNALITGDMSSSGERSLLRYAAIPYIDLLIVGHHGSRFSTSEELLAAASPEIAVISVGQNNYGHPSSETLRRLENYSVTVIRTDEKGHVTVTGNR